MTPHDEPHLWSPRLGVLFNEFKEEVPVHDGGVDSQQAAVYFRRSAKGRIVRTMVRQAESVFNLSQLMFALYHGQTTASTFRDLNDNRDLNAQHTIQGGFEFGAQKLFPFPMFSIFDRTSIETYRRDERIPGQPAFSESSRRFGPGEETCWTLTLSEKLMSKGAECFGD